MLDLTAIRRRYASLAEAKAAHPALTRLLLKNPAVIEYWDRGRVRTVGADNVPAPQAVARAPHASPAPSSREATRRQK